jgi:hypothetical protein
VNWTGFFSACGPLPDIGMRPDPTWNSTDSAPEPMSDGPAAEPSALSPWHDAQFAAKSFLPSSICVADTGASAAVAVPVTAA